MQSKGAVLPAEVISVRGEVLQLGADEPDRWVKGTKLAQLQTLAPGRGTAAYGALDPESVVVRFGGRTLERGRDYLLDPLWASLGIGPAASVGSEDTVTVDYRYSLRRLDACVRTADGRELIRPGRSALTVPLPAELKAGETRLTNLFVDYFGGGEGAEKFAVLESAAEAITHTSRGRIPRTLGKLRAGAPVKIVCWGDSVTVGGDASEASTRYVAVFERMLSEQFAQSDARVETVAVGGSQSQIWLDADNPQRQVEPFTQCRWERVVEARPDLVTIEFVNDAFMDEATVDRVYAEILGRIEVLGAEVILITPHFTMPMMMGFTTLREAEGRAYVLALRRFAERRGLAIADASSRWGHLWKEALPYVTLLSNGINHPDDRGHRLFAEELVKCFAD